MAITMLTSPILDVAIGLVFCYASVALIVSSVQEAVSSMLHTRSADLLHTLKRLLNADGSPVGKELLLGLYNHALVHPAGQGNVSSLDELRKRANRPEYIGAKNFATAFIDTIDSTQNRWGQLGASIDTIENAQLQKLLRGMRDRVQGDAHKLQAEIGAWFDAAMNQASGAYKRKVQLWCFGYALVLAVVFNIDSVHLFRTLWQQPAVASSVAYAASQAVGEAPPADAQAAAATGMRSLRILPVGWVNAACEDALYGWSASKLGGCAKTITPAQIIGWLITASAALFGAPFWFDLLQQLVRLRGTGPKPTPANEAKPQQPVQVTVVAPASAPTAAAPVADERSDGAIR